MGLRGILASASFSSVLTQWSMCKGGHDTKSDGSWGAHGPPLNIGKYWTHQQQRPMLSSAGPFSLEGFSFLSFTFFSLSFFFEHKKNSKSNKELSTKANNGKMNWSGKRRGENTKLNRGDDKEDK